MKRRPNRLMALMAIGGAVLLAVLVFDAFFLFFPARIPPFIQVMSLRGPWGEQIKTYNSLLRPHRGSFALRERRAAISDHPEFPDHEIRIQKVPDTDLWVRDADPVPPFDITFLGDSFTF